MERQRRKVKQMPLHPSSKAGREICPAQGRGMALQLIVLPPLPSISRKREGDQKRRREKLRGRKDSFEMRFPHERKRNKKTKAAVVLQKWGDDYPFSA